MSKKELETLIVDAKAAIGRAHERDRQAAREAAEKIAADYGFSLSELASGKAARKRATTAAAAKYANPENPAQTWTGKGRQPAWFKDAVAKGTAPEAMEL
ncbi:MAG: H-NS histone family protein [Pseudomonadota bacterium]